MIVNQHRRVRSNINDIINPGERHTKYSKLFRIAIATIVIIDLAVVIMGSFAEFKAYKRLWGTIFYVSAVIFLVEYGLRIWVAPLYNRGKKFAVIRYMTSFFGIMDLIVVIPFLMPILFSKNTALNELADFVCMFMIFKLARHSKSFKIIGSAFRGVRTELFVAFSVALIIVSFSAILMYYIERNAQPELFNNIGQGFWWAIITFTTVGYGDIYPITPLGKVLAAFIALIGIAMIALPTGIISSSFMHRIAEIKRKDQTKNSKKETKKYCPHCGKKLSNDTDND